MMYKCIIYKCIMYNFVMYNLQTYSVQYTNVQIEKGTSMQIYRWTIIEPYNCRKFKKGTKLNKCQYEKVQV